jgi:DNA-directed RNA polymerase specialized sigma24 family protein
MARIDWVEQRLKNWALWKAREDGGGRGFSSTTSFLHDADTSRYRESQIPVDEVESSVTNEAVETLEAHLRDTVRMIYLEDTGVRGAARRLNRAESTIHSHLGQADAYLARWFVDRKRRQEEARAQMLKGVRAR